jgi:hypothetical protein
MWKAARQQEKALRTMMSDYRKRVERKAAIIASRVNCDNKINFFSLLCVISVDLHIKNQISTIHSSKII